ncbi:serine/threonine-protein kinase [Nonomuraea sediminis]|uniref:serine/threonine-protein kinase n=1 Tax=Nonomuraea sediminis TaxID=2835864 RepID=UPI001BDC890A|nr:serine/threonine-protein kinase [Nonomuraea sediminis]
MFDARLLGGRYRLLGELGRGGMGRVWRARDELLDREVAVKEVVIPDELPEQEQQALARQSMREARVVARLAHPHIVTVHDVVVADGRPWIVLQLVGSRSLAGEIAERGPLPVSEVVRIGLEVLEALRSAHAAGVLHRDVKPANILLTCDGRAILTDFGLASTPGEDDVTSSGMVMGTPAYVAPERAGGGPSYAASDLWSLGVTLYSAVEGRAPFGGSTQLATLSAVVNAVPEPFRHAGPLAPIISALLAKDPDLRPDAAELQDQLVRLAALHHLDSHGPTAVPEDMKPAETGPLNSQVTARRRRRSLAAHWRQTVAMGALIGVAIATAAWRSAGTSIHEEPTLHRPARIEVAAPLRVSDERRAVLLIRETPKPPASGAPRGRGHAKGHHN